VNGAASTGYSLGYVFKNVAAGIDATVSVGAGDETANSDIGLTLRRSLSEVVAGLEARIVVGYNSGAGAAGSTTDYTYELQYNINKQFGIAYSVTDVDAVGCLEPPHRLGSLQLLIFGLEVSPRGPGNGALFVARVGRYLDSTWTVTRISRSPEPQ